MFLVSRAPAARIDRFYCDAVMKYFHDYRLEEDSEPAERGVLHVQVLLHANIYSVF